MMELIRKNIADSIWENAFLSHVLRVLIPDKSFGSKLPRLATSNRTLFAGLK